MNGSMFHDAVAMRVFASFGKISKATNHAGGIGGTCNDALLYPRCAQKGVYIQGSSANYANRVSVER